MTNIKISGFFVLLGSLALFAGGVQGASIDQQRKVFIQAEQFIEQGQDNAYKMKAATIKDYVLYPYLQYQWLKRNLQAGAEVKAFLQEYGQTRYAGLLKSRWLNYLAEERRWREFLSNYRKTKSTVLECSYYQAKYSTGYKKEALEAAKSLWVVGKSQPKQCDELFSALVKSTDLTDKMIWRRFALALKKGNTGLANYVLKLLNDKDQKTAKFWLQVHNKPLLIKKADSWQQLYPQAGLIFAHGVDRMARTDPEDASAIWDQKKRKLNIDQQRIQQLEQRLALALAYRRSNKAYSLLAALGDTDKTVREWRIRAALQQQNWKHVHDALKRLTPDELQEPNWQYWQGRALYATGKVYFGDQVFNKLAADRSFYGFLAAEHLKQDYQLSDKPIKLEPGQLEAFAEQPEFSMVKEFGFHQRDNEAQRQWWFAVGKLDNEQKLIAAKLAQQWGWPQVAIFTVAKAKHWDDMDLRFPLEYSWQVKKHAQLRKLDPAIVYGLIRRESAFDKNARSPVGARGLMQIMPRTGKQIARNLNEKWRSTNSLYDPDVNIKYGTFYYKKLLDQFNGHYALAAAGYNAGPHRVKRWLPSDGPVAADIWIETIPFKETRKYVAAVLAYAMIYQQRMGLNSLKMKDFMREIFPQ
jgi:peptidoglycan lytic transglycosylase